jgi:S-adenosylmethionine:tRNA ribosyltransferase-isomerase
MFTIEQFNYSLPAQNIAQYPADPRDHSRLLRLDRQTGQTSHHYFYDLPELLRPTDVLVRNNTKVLPARIYGKKETGGQCELLLVKMTGFDETGVLWECMTKPGLKPGQKITFPTSEVVAECREITNYTRIMHFNRKNEAFFEFLYAVGHTPIPPYIEWNQDDEQKLRQIYQTTYAKILGSVAAPTAGLHFTPELDEKLRQKGVQIEEVTLHVGLGTFLPLQEDNLTSGTLHHEFYEITPETALRLNQAKKAGKRIIAVGTTTTRTLETCASIDTTEAKITPQSGDTNLFIQPGYHYKFVDGLITNFHLPKSSLLMLISAFVSQPNTPAPFSDFASSSVGHVYQEAIQQDYRFYSFGDGMLII